MDGSRKHSDCPTSDALGAVHHRSSISSSRSHLRVERQRSFSSLLSPGTPVVIGPPEDGEAYAEKGGSQMYLHDNRSVESWRSVLSTDHVKWRSQGTEKFLLVAATLIPMVMSVILLVEHVRDYRHIGPLLVFAVEDRATAQIVVSILAAILATLNVHVITTLINLATRLHIIRRPLSLGWLKFIAAVATRRWANGLPVALAGSACIAVLLFALPNIVWTGALTPVIVNSTMLVPDGFRIPQYSEGSRPIWAVNSNRSRSACDTLTRPEGVFSNCATVTIQSSMLGRASQASLNATGLHTKNDFSHYSYIGRSFGVGSAVGLVNLTNIDQETHQVLGYSYQEPGYRTTVDCSRNTSTKFRIRTAFNGDTAAGEPSVFSVEGFFPWEVPLVANLEHFAAVGFGKDALAVVTAKYKLDEPKRNLIVGVAGQNYDLLSNMSCEVHFEPTLFDVDVSTALQLINVTAVPAAAAPNFDPTGALALTAMEQLNVLGMVATSLYTSVVGNALVGNVNASTPSNAPLDAKFAAVADSLEVMFDDILGFVAASQLFLPFDHKGDSTTAAVSVNVLAVKPGELKFVAVAFAMCVLLLVLLLSESIRTSSWRWLPRWDPTDTACLVLAGAVAGPDLLRHVSTRTSTGGMLTTYWSGGGDEQLTGTRLRIGEKTVRAGHLPGARLSTNEVAYMTAVSLWADDARDVEPLT